MNADARGDVLCFTLNGMLVEERDVSPTTTLLRYLRDVRGLTGTKEGCAEGDCGACTVAVAEPSGDGHLEWRAINSCLLLLPAVHGKQVVTVEGLRRDGEYHPAQRALAVAMGSQCGYCTSGIVMSLFEATYRTDAVAPWQLEDQLCGNLCRCTGYKPIREAAKAVVGTCPADGFSLPKGLVSPAPKEFDYSAQGQRFVSPPSLESLWAHWELNPRAHMIAGGTDVGLDITKRDARWPFTLSLEGIAALKRLDESTEGYWIGGGVTLTSLEGWSASRLAPLHRMLRYFGARQIKHRATVGGNLCTASPIGDLAPVLLSLDASAIVCSVRGERRMPLSEFFVSYRKTALQSQEILLGVWIPRLSESVRAVAYKVSKRRELDISTVSAAFAVDTDSAGFVRHARLAFGGVAPIPYRAAEAERRLLGRPWSEPVVQDVATKLTEELKPLSDHRGSAQYRLLVATNLFRAFYSETSQHLHPLLVEGHVATAQPAELA